MRASRKVWILFVALLFVVFPLALYLIHAGSALNASNALVKAGGLAQLPKSAHSLRIQTCFLDDGKDMVFIRFEASSDDLLQFIDNSASIYRDRERPLKAATLTFDRTVPIWWRPDVNAVGQIYIFSQGHHDDRVVGDVIVEEDTNIVYIYMTVTRPNWVERVTDAIGFN